MNVPEQEVEEIVPEPVQEKPLLSFVKKCSEAQKAVIEILAINDKQHETITDFFNNFIVFLLLIFLYVFAVTY